MSKVKKGETPEITTIAAALNKTLNSYSIAEYEQCTLVNAILLALQDDHFRSHYGSQAFTKRSEPTPAKLAKSVVDAIKRVLQAHKVDNHRLDTLLSEYSTIRNKPWAKETKLKKRTAAHPEDNIVIQELTKILASQVLPLMQSAGKGQDIIGLFYNEFTRQARADRKTGVVLTPQHITEFFCEVVNLNKNDVVFDSCCGTGGFLVAAMKHLVSLAGTDEKKKNHIKQNQLVGIEKRTDLFTFAFSNLMINGGCKPHIYQGDSFSEESRKRVEKLKPTVALLNPPYDVGQEGQLRFIENALYCLEKGGRCAAIIQMSCATSLKDSVIAMKKRLLEKHTLKAVFSMPENLFYPVAVITCVMVFEAHKPHRKSDKTYFGYYKDDGFTHHKTLGRVDSGKWKNIKSQWVDNFKKGRNKTGLSVLRHVDAKDEWCIEAYMKTDYSALTEEDFIKSIKDHVIFQFSQGNETNEAHTTKKPL
ncbi:MAG: methyltransferase [Gammaproteobacteria bacterium]|jgi:type I restriction-modification system DNA methylase subunit|nr:methyltransferase [Gammaproteobacteria bacterium]